MDELGLEGGQFDLHDGHLVRRAGAGGRVSAVKAETGTAAGAEAGLPPATHAENAGDCEAGHSRGPECTPLVGTRRRVPERRARCWARDGNLTPFQRHRLHELEVAPCSARPPVLLLPLQAARVLL